MDYFQLLCSIAILCLTFYYYLTSTYDFWEKRGVRGPRPLPFFGNFINSFIRKQTVSEVVKKLYDEYKHKPMFGIFAERKPVLVLNDLDLIKDVLIRDFLVFPDRGMPLFKKAEPLRQHLFQLEPERWRPLRVRLSPVFTSGKLKDMFPLIVACSKHLEDCLDKLVVKGKPVECRELAAKFTTDVIGSCAFGIDTNSLASDDNEFRLMGSRIFGNSIQHIFRLYMRQFLPTLYELFGYVIRDSKMINFFVNMTMDTIKYREENNVYRPDFINTLMELRKNPEKLDNIELTSDLLTSQAFVFFAAGFETSSTTISHAFYELAQHHEMQERLRNEIRENYAKNGEDLKYEHVKEMKYLDMVFRETLRKYPVLPILNRKSTANYTFRNTQISIPKGTDIWLPVYSLQRDPDIYPDPETFDPERFTDDACASRHAMSFLSFGDGPRNCIGARFAVFQSKVGIITILRNHKVNVCEQTTIPYKMDPTHFFLVPKNGVNLEITKVES